MDWDFFIAHRAADSSTAEQLAALLRPHSRVFEDSMLAPGVEWDVIGRHQRRSRITVVLVSAPTTDPGFYYREEITIGLRLAQRDPDGHRVVPVLLDPLSVDEIPYGLMIKNAIATSDEMPLTAVAERLLEALRDMPEARQPGMSEVAAAAVSFLSDIDSHLIGRTSEIGPIVEAVVAEFGDDVFTARLRKHGLEPPVLLKEVPEHANALTQWTRGDDGTAAAQLARFREHLASAVDAGRFPVTPAVATQVAAALHGSTTPELVARLRVLTRPARSTSREIVMVTSTLTSDPSSSLDPRGRRVAYGASRMCRIPAVDPHFCGRDELLDGLDDPGLLWISGRPGVGSSAVAIHLAHRMVDRYDKVLYLDLLGMDPDARRSARTTARILLEALGEPFPESMREDEALYERLSEALSSTNSLLVLDNARDAAQVGPILRADGAAATVVTSRQRVQSFTENAVHVPVLEPDAAIAMLARFAPSADRTTLARIAELCDNLPLALRLVAGRVRRPDVPVAELARLLEAEHTRLDYLEVGDRAVRGAILLSYEDLLPNARQVARYLACSFASVSAAELAYGIAEDESGTALALHRVVDASLAECTPTVRGPVHFRLPPLVRLVAVERSAAEDEPGAVTEFRRRLVRYLADRLGEINKAASEADVELEVDPTRAHAALTAAVAEKWWDSVLALGQELQVVHMSNFDLSALSNVTEAVVSAYLGTQEPDRAVSTAGQAAEDLRESEQHRSRALAWARRAEEIAREYGLTRRRIEMCMKVSGIAVQMDETGTALEYARTAASLSTRYGSPTERINPLSNLGRLLLRSGKDKEALPYLQHAADLADGYGDASSRAKTQFDLAEALWRLGRLPDARRGLHLAATLYAADNQLRNAATAKRWEARLAETPQDTLAPTSAVVKYLRQAGRSDAPRLAQALVALSATQLALGMNEDASTALDEADDCEMGDHGELAYEISVRRAALRYRLRRDYQLPDREPFASKFLHDMVEIMATHGSHDRLDLLLRLPPLHPVPGPKFWVFETLGEPKRPQELGSGRGTDGDG